MWVAHTILHRRASPISAGLGAGVLLAAAIGVQLAHPNSRVINVTGDGSIMMNIQELATVKRYNLPIKIVVLDNQCLGMVRQWQDLFLGKRYSEVDLSDNPDFVQLAEAFGFEPFRVTHPDQVEELSTGSTTVTPMLAHVVLDRATQVWPLVPPGKANHEMLEEGLMPR